MTRKQEQLEAIASLRDTLTEGDTIHVSTKHVSRSGMSRGVDLYKFYVNPEGAIRHMWLTRLAARALGWRFADKSETLVVNGCGMDMHYHAVESLSYAVFGKPNALHKESL